MGELRKWRLGRARLISNAGVGVGGMFVLGGYQKSGASVREERSGRVGERGGGTEK